MKISELQIQRNIQSTNFTGKINTLPQKSSFSVDKSNMPDFSTLLKKELQSTNNISFSAHAKKRIADRNISVDLERLETGIKEVQKKGAQNSLVLIDNNAYIVNIKNKTVVTAIDQQSIKNNVFTNIDSVAIV